MISLSAHLGYLFNEVPLEEKFAAAARAGFTFVEHPGPYALPASDLAALCEQNGLNFVQLALPSGDAQRGEKGIACLPGREKEFLESIEVGLAYANQLRSPFVHVMAGVRPEQVPTEALWATYIENLRLACKAASRFKIEVLIEPIGSGTIANYLVDLPSIAARAIEEVGAPNLFMLFDVFHTLNSGLDPVDNFLGHKNVIRHLHIADYPGRHEPGTGTFDFQSFFRLLDQERYGGKIGLEYIPAGLTEPGLAWASSILKSRNSEQ